MGLDHKGSGGGNGPVECHEPEALRLQGGNPVDRTRSAVTNGLRNKLKELMMEFQVLRQRMMIEYKETVGRRYFTVTGELPDGEVIEKIITSGDGNDGEVFLSRAIKEQGKGKVVGTVVEIQDHRDAAKEIKKYLLELHQIFLDMTVMGEALGEQMDDVEHHVMNTRQYVGNCERSPEEQQEMFVYWDDIAFRLILLVVIPIATSFSKS